LRRLNQHLIKQYMGYDPITGQTVRLKTTARRQTVGEEVGWNANGYRRATFLGKQYPVAHLIWLSQTGSWPTGVVDHIDGNPLNNSWSNLRDVTQKENMSNKHGAQSNSRLGILGVDKLNGRYRARIKSPGKTQTHLGMYDTAEEAYQAYVTARADFAPVEGL
jgi:hypothetical protein